MQAAGGRGICSAGPATRRVWRPLLRRSLPHNLSICLAAYLSRLRARGDVVSSVCGRQNSKTLMTLESLAPPTYVPRNRPWVARAATVKIYPPVLHLGGIWIIDESRWEYTDRKRRVYDWKLHVE